VTKSDAADSNARGSIADLPVGLSRGLRNTKASFAMANEMRWKIENRRRRRAAVSVSRSFSKQS